LAKLWTKVPFMDLFTSPAGSLLRRQLLLVIKAAGCELKCLSNLLHEADARLFQKMANNKQHCIHQLLPPPKILPIKLRHCHCLFALPQCQPF